MQLKKKKKQTQEPVDIECGIDLLTGQIEAARKMLAGGTIQSKAHETWNEETRACLIRVYGEGSPNIDTITEASGTAPAWLSMPDDVAERYAASSLENKMQKLEACVVALRRKNKETGDS